MAVNRPNGNKINKHRPPQHPRIFTQIGIFGLKTYHLATLSHSRSPPEKCHGITFFSQVRNVERQNVEILIVDLKRRLFYFPYPNQLN
jgi:hypothetical protein